ncbi:MAG: hypothetical protein RKE49_14855 [Oceanicaulis sp.]
MAYPEVDKARYAVWGPNHPLNLHWRLNPALAVNELILGQRQPAVLWIERDASRPLLQRQYVPCPHCHALNHGMLYKHVAFGAYAGLVCAACGEKIPTLKNALTWLVLIITWPIWKPLEGPVGGRLLARQRAKLAGADTAKAENAPPPSALRMGLLFGGLMTPVFFAINFFSGAPLGYVAAIGAGSGVAAGVLFGVAMKIVLGWRGRGAKTPA